MGYVIIMINHYKFYYFIIFYFLFDTEHSEQSRRTCDFVGLVQQQE